MKIKAIIFDNENKEEVEVSSNLIDMIYTIIKGTYLEKNEICIDNPTIASREELSDFLTYI